MTTIVCNLQLVRDRILMACIAAARDPQSVRLLAVSKRFDADAVRQAMSDGQRAFGENYIAEGVDKIQALRAESSALAEPLEWHCIGPIQSNKTRPVAEHFDWVQSIDRLKIAERLSEQRPAHLPPLNVCLQVNIDGGPTKSGVTPGDALALAHAVAALPHLKLRGIMTLPEPAVNFSAACAVHSATRALFEQIKAAGVSGSFDTLSMGMSDDLEAAIESGSTMVRVGTAIFGQRPGAPI